ncbi:MAG: hypothetical protein QM817_09390 [Archangium sp.]
MFLAAYLTLLSAQLPVDIRAGENKLTQLEFKQNNAGLTWDWSDTEETLRGTVTPLRLKAGKPMVISAIVEALSSEEINGPMTFSIRPLKEMGSAQTQTVAKGETRVWSATFTPEEAGDYRLEISWRTTHHKVVRGVFTVADRGLPEWVSWTIGGGALAIALAVGLWVLFGKKNADDPGASST